MHFLSGGPAPLAVVYTANRNISGFKNSNKSCHIRLKVAAEILCKRSIIRNTAQYSIEGFNFLNSSSVVQIVFKYIAGCEQLVSPSISFKLTTNSTKTTTTQITHYL